MSGSLPADGAAANHPASCWTDAGALEMKLKPYERIFDRLQSMLFWKSPFAMVMLLLMVNIVFFIIYKLQLTFVPTVLLLMSLKVFGELLSDQIKSMVMPVLFKEMDTKDDGLYAIYSVREISELIVFFTSRLIKAFNMLNTAGSAQLSSVSVPLVSCVALFVLFLFTGTLALNWWLVNILLITPAVAMHPSVKPFFALVLSKMTKTKKNK